MASSDFADDLKPELNKPREKSPFGGGRGRIFTLFDNLQIRKISNVWSSPYPLQWGTKKSA
jgi:hypothetical protein